MFLKFLMKFAKPLASICAVIALLLFIPAGLIDSTPLFILLAVLIALFLIAGIILLYLGNRYIGAIHNYFVYEPGAKKRISLSELTVEAVTERVDAFLTPYTDDYLSLWEELPKKLRIELGNNASFRPLVAYRMLLALSQLPSAQAIAVFEASDAKNIAYACQSLAGANDKQMADYLFALKKGGEATRKTAASFFRKNRELFAGRMLAYVRQNIHAFDLPESTKEKK